MPSIRILWNYTPIFRPFSPVANAAAARDKAAATSRARTGGPSTQTHQEASTSMAGAKVAMFGGLFYERFHVSTLSFTLGNLVGNQVRELTIWNAYRRARVLESLDLLNGEGITIGGQPPAPLQFAPLQLRTYTLEISSDGPPNVDATLVFDLDEGESITIDITGSRVTPWIFKPDWSRGLSESLEWLTDILESENATEQAISMRIGPRRSLGFSFGAELQERQAMESAVAGWSGRVWSVPMWMDGVDVPVSLPAGSQVVPVPTIGRDFEAGGLAMLMGEGWRDYEVVEVDSLTSAQVILRRPTARSWPSGSVLYPARTARMDAGVTFNRFTGQAHTGSVQFNMLGPNDWPELQDMPLYRGLPVLEDIPEWSQEPQILHERKLAVVDVRTGRPEVTDMGDLPLIRQANRWTVVGRAEIARMRSLLYRLRGKHRAVWVPSWVEDFTLAAQAAETSTQLLVDWQGYALYLNGARNRRDIRIASSAGVEYARIQAATEQSSAVERLAIDNPLARTYEPGATTINYMTLFRLDTDLIEWAWWCGDMGSDQATADLALPMRSFRHDI